MESQLNSSSNSLPQSPPPPPVPSSDPGLALQHPLTPEADFPSPQLAALADDIFTITPIAALKLLGAGIEALVRITGDIPPTPPPSNSYVPNMRGMQAEKESIVRSHSEKNLARLREEAEAQAAASASAAGLEPTLTAPAPMLMPMLHTPHASIDGVRLRATMSNPTPITPSPTPEPYIVIGANSQPLNLQHSAITRKFYSKKPPPIGISDYLLRMHRFCPMSTAVYLATSLYIYRLAVLEKAIVVTKRNAHRLLLAGLRVAMKALEDLSYPHAKVAKVGGVSEAELARLEISFCFLAGFELVVREDEMTSHWILMKTGRGVGILGREGIASVAVLPQLRLDRPPREGT